MKLEELEVLQSVNKSKLIGLKTELLILIKIMNDREEALAK